MAVKAPFSLGPNSITTVQLPPAAIDPVPSGQVELDWMGKLLPSVPVTEILVVAIEVVAVLVRVTVWGALEVFTVCVPKLKLVGEMLRTVPTPLNVAVCGLLAALDVTVTVPVCVPAAVGVKTRLMVQLAFPASVVPQLLVWLYGPVVTMLPMAIAAVPVLASVAGWEALLVLTSWVAKVKLEGVRVALPVLTPPVPDMGTVCGLPPPAATTLRVALRAPLDCGSKTTTMVQLAPPASDPVPRGQVELLWMAKLLEFVPVTEILVKGTAVVLKFAMVTVCGELELPTAWLPKLRLVGEKERTVPTPLRVAV